MMVICKLLLVIVTVTLRVEAGHYLVWLPMSSKSVKIGVMEAGEELARRGHEVTVISPHKYKAVPPGVTEIALVSPEFDKFTTSVSDTLSNPKEMPVFEMIEISMNLNKQALEIKEVQDILTNRKIDVLITVPVPAFANELSYYLAKKTDASLVIFLTAPFGMINTNHAIGDPYNPAYMANPITGYTQQMTFPQRLINTGITVAYMALRYFYIVPKTEAILRQTYPNDDIPGIDELSRNAALSINHGTPFTGDGLRPSMPQMITAGFMSCHPARPLPEDLEQFISQSQHGVIFVSFGSVVKAAKMPEAKRKMMLAAFSRLKQRVIWKWETSMEDAPDNVMISSWLPQTSLLAHPGVKLFITHGGAGSIQETVCHKTPIVGIPITGDQGVNIKEVVNKKVGLEVSWHEMNEDSLHAAITEVLEDPEYQRSVSRLSELIMDQPQHPLERAVWWLEYLLRHPHNPGMRPASHDLSWPQYFLLDVMAAFVFIVTIPIILLIKILRRCCCSRKAKQD